jgi:hypothetical protein
MARQSGRSNKKTANAKFALAVFFVWGRVAREGS